MCGCLAEVPVCCAAVIPFPFCLPINMNETDWMIAGMKQDFGFVKMRRWECFKLKFTPPSETGLSHSSYSGCWSPPPPPYSSQNSKPRVSPHFSRYHTRSFHKVCSLNWASEDHPGNNRDRLVSSALDNSALCADLLGRILICHNRGWWWCS